MYFQPPAAGARPAVVEGAGCRSAAAAEPPPPRPAAAAVGPARAEQGKRREGAEGAVERRRRLAEAAWSEQSVCPRVGIEGAVRRLAKRPAAGAAAEATWRPERTIGAVQAGECAPRSASWWLHHLREARRRVYFPASPAGVLAGGEKPAAGCFSRTGGRDCLGRVHGPAGAGWWRAARRPRRGAGIPTSRRRAVGGWVERGGGGQASGECVCLPALTLVD